MTENSKKDLNEAQTNFSDEDIRLVDLFKVFLEQKKIIILIVFSASLVAAIYSLTITPVFRSEALLISAEQNNQGLSGLAGSLGGLGALAGININDGNFNSSETVMAILESRTFSESFIKEKNLMPILFYKDWDSSNKSWKDNNAPSMWDAHNEMKDIISISKDRRTGLMELSVEWNDPDLAAEWANDAVKKLNNYMRQQVIEESNKSIRFLEEQLAKTNEKQSRELLFELLQEQTNKSMMANVREEFSLRIIDPAVPPEKRIRPHRKVIVAYGFAIGLFLGIGFVLIKNVFREGFFELDHGS
tara:strand:+ start:1987 stop:2895 length:909 start_codon:yes stop_codon:yes gene_type:complete